MSAQHAPERMDFCEGKYTIINNRGILTAMRNGEPWGRDLVGDNLVYWMLVEAVKLREQRDELLAALRWGTEYIEAMPAGSHAEAKKWAAISRTAIAKATGESA